MSPLPTLLLILSLPAALAAQNFTQRGYVEMRGQFFPQTAPGDSSHALGEIVLRWDVFYKIGGDWTLNGSLDARTDTHHQDARELRLDWQDRTPRRPAISLRRFSATWHKGGLTFEAGKQFIRWGKADILNPTDRFAPRDFLEVVNFDFLGVLAARATYESGGNTFDLVYTPRVTPSRSPLPDQRWVIIPVEATGFTFVDGGVRYPGAGQVGARWNHVGRGYELSTSFFEGFQNLPSLNLAFASVRTINVSRFFPRLRMYGADAAVPLHWFTVKGEAGYFTSSDTKSDEFLLYVIQLERQQGEWSFVGGYAGEYVTAARNAFFFSPERGTARTFLGRAGYTFNTNRSASVETAVRQNGQGAYVKAEYSQAFGAHWRATAGFVLLRGDQSDFLGQYHRNSHALLTIRYSF